MFRKGSIIIRKNVTEETIDSRTGEPTEVVRKRVVVVHEDLIRDKFWKENAHLLKD